MDVFGLLQVLEKSGKHIQRFGKSTADVFYSTTIVGSIVLVSKRPSWIGAASETITFASTRADTDVRAEDEFVKETSRMIEKQRA